MKKSLMLISGLFLTITMQAQDRPQPKPGPAPVINIKTPESFSLPNGLKVLVVEDHKLPRVSYSLYLDNAPYVEGNKKGVSALMGNMLGNGSTKTTKDAYNEEVDFLGANLNFSANGATASTLSKYSDRILELLAEGVLMPNFTQQELDKEKAQLIESLRADEKSVAAIADRVRDVLAYGKNHPSGEYYTEETINNVTLADIQHNYDTYFVPGNAYLIIVGDVKTADLKPKVTDLFELWEKATAPKFTYNEPKNVQYTQINFVDVPTAVQSEITVLNTVKLQMKDPDFFPAIIANQVLGGNFTSYLNMNLREKRGFTYGANSSISGSRYVTTFSASAQVRNAVTDSAVVEFMNELRHIRKESVADEMLKEIKAGYIGRFVMQADKPQTIARFAVNIEIEGLPEDYYRTYYQKVSAVTAADVNRVANKYFMADNARIIVVGKGSEVLPGLEKLNIPIFYFDKYGNPVAKPEAPKAAPATVTAQKVFESYLKAIGGQKAVAAVKSIYLTASAVIPQAPAPLAYTMKKDSKGRTLNSVSIEGFGEMSKQVIGETSGYVATQGVKKELTAEEFAEKKSVAGTFDELNLIDKTGLTVDRIEPVNGKDAYVIKNGKTTLYYDVASGLKVMEEKTTDHDGQTTTTSTTYDDYRDVNGIKFPFRLIMHQGLDIDFKVGEIKLNEGVSDADFQ